MRLVIATSVVALATLTACPKGTGDPDGGTPPPDVCNSKDDALNVPDCKLPVNGPLVEGYIGTVGDQDWYSIQLPSTVTGRTLLQVTAGYGGALGTPVDFSASILKADATSAIATGVDHPVGAPHYVTLVVPLDASYAGQTLFLLVSDSSNTQRDARTPYHIQVVVQDNPDNNEPNDTIANATAINLSGTTGTAVGFLATPNDIDQFTFTVPNGRKIVYVHATAPVLNPPASPQLALSYQLYNGSNVKISEGNALPLLAADLATARLSNPTGGTYRLVVQGYRPPSQPNLIIPGDLRFQYNVTVMVLDDLDTNEGAGGNDTLATAKSIGANSTTTGRISYVGDADWYVIDSGLGGTQQTLHYKLTPSGTAGRFPPLPGPLDRLVRVFTPFGAGSAVCQDETLNNPADPSQCPKDLGNLNGKNTAETFCAGTPSLCLRSQRLENLSFANLRNLEGVVPIRNGAPAGTYYIVVQDEGTNWADDSDYTLTLTLSTDGDENARGDPGGTTTLTVQENGAYSETPAPATALNGVISYGHGRLLNHQPVKGDGVRAPQDYDGEVSDADKWKLNFPSTAPLPAGWRDRAWALQWVVQKVGGAVPSDLEISAEFCDGSGGGACVPVTQTPGGAPFDIAFQSGNLSSWQSRDAGDPNFPIFGQANNPTNTTSLVLAAGCLCVEPRMILGGYMNLIVRGVDRNTWDPITYTVNTALAPYPQPYTVDGGAAACPTPKPDGGGFAPGCLFESQ